MSLLGRLRANWRIVLLVVLLVAATYFLFVPGAPISGAAADPGGGENGTATAGATNLQYGIQLGGGARLTAPVHGMVAEDVGVTPDNNDEVRQSVQEAMNLSETEVVTSVDIGAQEGFPQGTVEVRSPGSQAAFVRGLQDAGLDVSEDDVRPGVTDYTRQEVVDTLDRRLGQSGFSGGSVTQVRGADQLRVRVEAPGQDLERLRELATQQGRVEIVAHTPADNERGYERTTILTGEDFVSISPVAREGSRPYVPVTVSEPAADEMTTFMQESGFAANGAEYACRGLDPGPDEWCLLTQVDNDTVFNSGVDSGLADQFETGSFREERSFRVFASNFSEAQQLRINMRSGALPSTMDVDNSSQLLINPALAEGFRTNSLLTGVLAVLAVVLAVFLRYGDPRVAVPMSATALSEVVILMGFAAAIGWPLELSHIAGFIAVIGTGVDDLIIIADEVKAEGEVSSNRVFQSRFRKAFWVIGAAAATTIIAMSPLAVLNLGDLRGFAIITILGVLVGVAITRPAYGNILRSLVTR